MDRMDFNTMLVLKNLAFLMKFSCLSILLLVPEYHSLRPNKTNDPAVNNCRDVILEHLSSDTSAAVQTLCKHFALCTKCKHCANIVQCKQLSANNLVWTQALIVGQIHLLPVFICLFTLVAVQILYLQYISHWLQCK